MKYTIITCSSAFSSIWKYTKEPDIDIKWAFRGSGSKILSFIRVMWFQYNLPLKKIWINRNMVNLGSINIVFDSGANEFLLRWIKEHNPGKRCILYYWNVISDHTPLDNEKIRNMGYEIWGFDFDDSRKHGYTYNSQFFCPSWYSDLKNTNSSLYDISFVGRDKNRRMQNAEKMVATLSGSVPLKSNLYFAAPKWYLAFKNKKYKKILRFKEMLQQELNGKILLDITDEGQSGYTLRVFDALCNGRKLVTNNAHIVNEDFYDKRNIFVYGMDNLKDFEIFMNTPFYTEKTEQVYSRDIAHWLTRFLR
ncbi:MAG: hypothetical protein K2N73_17495 [Lachnospiraceae bacterium]|nr:hypothetical protein [Lachnospiraceae bacterium]